MSENTKPCVNFNENGKVIYKKDSKGFEECYEYDENNNLIHHKNSNGFENIGRIMMKKVMKFIIKIVVEMKNGINMMKKNHLKRIMIMNKII